MKISREHPAFFLALAKCAFPTKPIRRTYAKLLKAMEDGDASAERDAVENLEFMLHLGTDAEWIDKTGRPAPDNLEELAERMAGAGFTAEMIHRKEWTPQSVTPVILGRGKPSSATAGKSVGSAAATAEVEPKNTGGAPMIWTPEALEELLAGWEIAKTKGTKQLVYAKSRDLKEANCSALLARARRNRAKKV